MRISDWSSDVCSSDLLTSNDSPACTVSAVWPSQVRIATVFGAPRTVIRTVCLPLTTIERSDSVCGQIGTSVNASRLWCTHGPPPDRAYAFEPLGLARMKTLAFGRALCGASEVQ